MSTIVVPTDFSAPADNALLYAGALARTIGASIVLLHVYQVPISMNDVPVLMVSADELKSTSDKGLETAKELLLKNEPGIQVTIESRLGDVLEELNDLVKEIKPTFIVVGKHGASGMERLLFGSTSLSIIRHSTIPVIAVPYNNQHFQLKNVGLAVDVNGTGKHTAAIGALMEQLQAKLHLIHVQTDSHDTSGVNNSALELKASYHTILDHDFVHGIQVFIASNAIDMLLILPHKHSLMDRFFFKTHTPELVQKLTVPIMCLNEV
jgi:nucleotide-binding universal stress UspA family protein